MKTSTLTFNLTTKAEAVSLSLHLSIHLPEQHNRKKEKFKKSPFLSDFYQRTNLKQVIAQNSLHCFVNFHVFFVLSFLPETKIGTSF